MTLPQEEVLRSHMRNWSLRKIDVRAPLKPNSYPVVRVELDHPDRGPVTDVASASGTLDAAFCALGQIIGLKPRLLSFDVRSQCPIEEAMTFRVHTLLEFEGRLYRGTSLGLDLLRCAVEAWLSAAALVGTLDQPPAVNQTSTNFPIGSAVCKRNFSNLASSVESARTGAAR